MRANNTIVLKGADSLSFGELTNTTLLKGCLALEQTAGRHVLCGSYTSQPLVLDPFDRAIVSWNAQTPRGTVVEAQIRLLQEEGWSAWYSCGKWSPYIQRKGVWQDETLAVSMQGDVLHLKNRATQVQIRMYLYTENESLTPFVHQITVSVRPVSWQKQQPEIRTLHHYLPAYSVANRDPGLATSLDIPMAVASLMNRYGQDILPEEVALNMRDHHATHSENRSFAAALAGCYGYAAHTAYLDATSVWHAIKEGHSVAVSLRCLLHLGEPPCQSEEPIFPVVPQLPKGVPFWRRKQTLLQLQQQALQEAQQRKQAQINANNAHTTLTDATDPNGQTVLMPLRGFAEKNDELFALVNDPTALTDEAACRSFPLGQFWQAFTGVSLVIQRKEWALSSDCPHRTPVQLHPCQAEGEYFLATKEGTRLPLPLPFDGSVACTLQTDTVHASTAHKRFYYASVLPNGNLLLPKPLLAQPKKITVYAICPNGDTLVGTIAPA